MSIKRFLRRMSSHGKRGESHANGIGEQGETRRSSTTSPPPAANGTKSGAELSPPPSPNPSPTCDPPSSTSPTPPQSSANGTTSIANGNSITVRTNEATEKSKAAGKEARVTAVADAATGTATIDLLSTPTQIVPQPLYLGLRTSLDEAPVSVDGRSISSYEARPLSPGEINHIMDGPQFSHHEEVMNDAVDKLEVPMNSLNKAQMNLNNFGPSGNTVQAIESGIRGLSEGLPILMKALDECSKAHPFIAVAVLAFRAAYSLETKRRDNDRKVLALFVEMRDMMSVLTQLSTLKDSQIPAADGTSTASRLEALCHQTAADIRSCSNTCDTYNRKRLLVKCLAGPVWEARLGTYVTLFTKRREEFLFAMSVRTTIGMQDVGQTVKDIEVVVKEANERTKLLLAAFEKLVSPEQKEMESLINKHGGPNEVKNNDKALQQLLKESNHLVEKGEDTLRPAITAAAPGSGAEAHSGSGNVAPGSSGPSTGTQNARKPLTVEAVRSELSENIDFVLAKNMEIFHRKFEIQKRQIVEDLAKLVGREGDRIIAAVTTGPHDRILDPDMHTIWKDMGWKGSVKARHFVLALRDYYFEKTQRRKHQGGENEKADLQESQDLWALHYLDLHYLQTIHEAIDDDASGFITVEELNLFTSSRPLDWSLVKWLAFWAIGFNIAMCEQRKAINQMLDEMISLVPVLLPGNRTHARTYLYHTWEKIVTVTSSLEGKWSSEFLEKMFKEYIQSEEDRIKRNIIDVKYRIDGVDTLYLVTGPGRVERSFFPLVKVLVERHLQIFRIARTKMLHRKELEDAYTCFNHLKNALDYRLYDLKAICTTQGRDLAEWLKKFAQGIFEYHNDMSLVWSFDRMVGYEYSQDAYEAKEPFDDSNYLDILNRGEGRANIVDTSAYEKEPALEGASKSADQTDKVHPLIGTWHVLLYDNSSDIHPYRSLFTETFKPAEIQPEDEVFAFTASGNLSTGEGWSLTGTCRPMEENEEKLSMAWILKYTEEYDDQYFSGTLDKSVMRIDGTAGSDPDVEKHGDVVVLSQQPADVIIHRPHPTVLANLGKRISALWQFAHDAILHQVRKQMWSWSYFKARRDNRIRYLDLVMRRNWFYKPLTDEETQEFFSVKRKQFVADNAYFTSLELMKSIIRVHVNRVCDICGGNLVTDRIVCLECKPDSSPFNSIDTCHDKDCMTSEITRSDLVATHYPSHRTFKSRKFLMIRDMGYAWTKAQGAISKGDQAITDALASYKERSTITRARSEKSSQSESSSPSSEDCEKSEAEGRAASGHSETSGKHTGHDESDNPVVEEQTSAPTHESLEEDPNVETAAIPPLPEASDVTVSEMTLVSPVSEAPADKAPGPIPTDIQEQTQAIAAEIHEDGNASEPPEQTRTLTEGEEKHIVEEANGEANYVEDHQEADAKSEANSEASGPVSEDETASSRTSHPSSRSTAPPSSNLCYYCGKRLQSPCWYCVDCTNTILVCADCDPPGGFSKGAHEKEHFLLNVRVVEEKEEVDDDKKVIDSVNALESKVDSKLASLHESLSSLQGGLETRDERINTRIATLDDKFCERLKAMEDRFSRVEDLLQKLLMQRVAMES